LTGHQSAKVSSAREPELQINGAVARPEVLTGSDLKKMTRKTLRVINPHKKNTEQYEGVLLADILQKAGIPHGEQLRGPAMETYVIAEGSDGYRVVFSHAELDAGIVESDIIVADSMDGAPLPAKDGPFRLVAPHENVRHDGLEC
jgi:DMSO/TMAO reductase YedYZ molybdopterin-dependent catalytic subunit